MRNQTACRKTHLLTGNRPPNRTPLELAIIAFLQRSAAIFRGLLSRIARPRPFAEPASAGNGGPSWWEAFVLVGAVNPTERKIGRWKTLRAFRRDVPALVKTLATGERIEIRPMGAAGPDAKKHVYLAPQRWDVLILDSEDRVRCAAATGRSFIEAESMAALFNAGQVVHDTNTRAIVALRTDALVEIGGAA